MRSLDPNTLSFEKHYNDFRWQVPEKLNIAYEVCDKHGTIADHIAIYYEHEDGQKKQLSFVELQKHANQFANVLQSKGIKKGNRIAIVLSQRIETAIAHIAIYKLGAVAIPLSVLFGDEALKFRLSDSECCAVIYDSQKQSSIQELSDELPNIEFQINCDAGDRSIYFWQLLSNAKSDFQNIETFANDPALLIYTSGTTGPPKGAVIAHRAILATLTGFELSHNFFPRNYDLFWTPADWAWTGGLWDALLPSLYFGVPVLAYQGGKFDPEKALYLMEQYSVRNSFIPPTALRMMRNVSDISKNYKLCLRSIMSAGESVGEELIHWGKEHLNVDINEMWGQTEFNYLVGNSAEIMPIKPGSMGKPYPGHKVIIIDEQGNECTIGSLGEIAVHGQDPIAFLGYWKNDTATQKKYIKGWFRTGDTGYRDEDGYLWFVGRNDDVISSAGYRIGPGEIEDVLLSHPAVIQAAAIGVTDELRGEKIKAYLLLSKGYSASEQLKTDIQNTVKNKLAAYEYPRDIEFIKEFPMTTSGKVKRNVLRQRHNDGLTEK